jgi:hypothetical protein
METKKVTAPIVRTFSEYLPEPFEDQASDSVKYVGWAPMGVDKNSVGWRIMRETKTGNVIEREYAGGTMDFNFVWEDRASYDYSR